MMKPSGLRIMCSSVLAAVLSWNVGCAESNSLGGGGTGSALTPECRTDEECRQALGSDGVACDADGKCFECEHEDPFGGPVETPAFWNPDRLVAGDELGLDDQLAYWELPLIEYGLQGQPTPDVWVCSPLMIQAGEIVDSSTDCESLQEDEFLYDGQKLIAPVAPSAWLSSELLNGLYYTEVLFEFGPIYLCP